jgi:hypothetical protein
MRCPYRPDNADTFSLTRTITSVVDVIRSRRPLPVRITHRIASTPDGFSASLLRVRPIGCRRQVRLTWQEEDRALFKSLAKLPV